MTNELKAILDAYIEEFLNQDLVKKYFIIEEQINNSLEINNLTNELKNAQKNLALSLNDHMLYEENKKRYISLKKTFDEHPLIVNYNSLKEEIYLRLNNLSSQLKSNKS